MGKKLAILLIAKFLVCIANPVAQNDEEDGEFLKYPKCLLPGRSNSYTEGERIYVLAFQLNFVYLSNQTYLLW